MNRRDIIMLREDIAIKVRDMQRNFGLKVAMASGAFDLLHAGHVSYLEALRERVGMLVVAVTPDSTVAKKGPNRPIIPLQQRMDMLAALRCVDGVFTFNEWGDDINLKIVRPDIFARGDGYTTDITEAETLKRFGIELVLIHTPRVTSTTEIINRIRQ